MGKKIMNGVCLWRRESFNKFSSIVRLASVFGGETKHLVDLYYIDQRLSACRHFAWNNLEWKFSLAALLLAFLHELSFKIVHKMNSISILVILIASQSSTFT